MGSRLTICECYKGRPEFLFSRPALKIGHGGFVLFEALVNRSHLPKPVKAHSPVRIVNFLRRQAVCPASTPRNQRRRWRCTNDSHLLITEGGVKRRTAAPTRKLRAAIEQKQVATISRARRSIHVVSINKCVIRRGEHRLHSNCLREFAEILEHCSRRMATHKDDFGIPALEFLNQIST